MQHLIVAISFLHPCHGPLTCSSCPKISPLRRYTAWPQTSWGPCGTQCSGQLGSSPCPDNVYFPGLI